MTRDEVIKKADICLSSIPILREHIRLIDIELEKDSKDTDTINKLRQEKHRLKFKLSIIIKMVSCLDSENQRLIYYKYFDKLSFLEIELKEGSSISTVKRKISKNKLILGRIMFGFEDEFLYGLCDDHY
jgi:hypothetical protein